MPTYAYKGKMPFTNLDYDLYDVKPNSTVITKHLLPDVWKDFELIDILPNDALQKSEEYTVTDTIEIDVSDFNQFTIKLKNASEASVQIHLAKVDAPVIKLDSAISYYSIKNFVFDKIYLMPDFGQPNIIIFYQVQGSRVL